MKKRAWMIGAGMMACMMFLGGCASQNTGAKETVITKGEKPDTMVVGIVEDLIVGDETDDVTLFTQFIADRLEENQGVTVASVSKEFTEGEFTKGSLADRKYDYLVVALGAGTKDVDALDDEASLTSAYEKELTALATSFPNVPILCVYDFYYDRVGTAIHKAIENAKGSISNTLIDMDINDHAQFLDRSNRRAVHEILGTYVVRQIQGMEALKEGRLDPDKPMIALTFDDGPNDTTTVQILDILKQYDVKASFFLIGNNITAASTATVVRECEEGHEINTHSNAHDYMNKMEASAIQADMSTGISKIVDACGVYPRFFRPPYIAVSNEMYANICYPFISGYGCNDWDPNVDVQTRIDGVLANAKDGEVILLHDAAGNTKTVEALPAIIEGLRDAGYQFATCTELFAYKNIVPTTGKVYSNSMQEGAW